MTDNQKKQASLTYSDPSSKRPAPGLKEPANFKRY